MRVIIPAAGVAERFFNIPKELLPVSSTECCLTRAVRMARFIGGDPVVITSRDKYDLHARILKDHKCELLVKREVDYPELWGSIMCGMQRGISTAVMLADVVMEFDMMEVRQKVHELAASHNHLMHIGCFSTLEPHRFSVVDYGRHKILTKSGEPAEATRPRSAWGMLMWGGSYSTKLLDHEPFDHYDRAIEYLMRMRRYSTFTIQSYDDLGTFEAYRRFTCSQL